MSLQDLMDVKVKEEATAYILIILDRHIIQRPHCLAQDLDALLPLKLIRYILLAHGYFEDRYQLSQRIGIHD